MVNECFWKSIRLSTDAYFSSFWIRILNLFYRTWNPAGCLASTGSSFTCPLFFLSFVLSLIKAMITLIINTATNNCIIYSPFSSFMKFVLVKKKPGRFIDRAFVIRFLYLQFRLNTTWSYWYVILLTYAAIEINHCHRNCTRVPLDGSSCIIHHHTLHMSQWLYHQFVCSYLDVVIYKFHKQLRFIYLLPTSSNACTHLKIGYLFLWS